MECNHGAIIKLDNGRTKCLLCGKFVSEAAAEAAKKAADVAVTPKVNKPTAKTKAAKNAK